MIVERVPEFLFLHRCDGPDSIAFDKRGRFIYIKRELSNCSPNFLIYDIMFNNYIELTPDTSVTDLKVGNKGPYEKDICATLPINIDQFLLLQKTDDLSRRLILIHFDLRQRSYGVLDQVQIEKCQQIKLMRDGDTFGLFFVTSQSGEYVNDVDNEDSKFALLSFKIHNDKILLDTQVKKFNHRPHNSNSNPLDLYLRRDKLWFIRRKDGPEFAPFIRPHEPVPPPDPLKDDLIISYYDLNQACPTEIQVDEIKLAILGLPEISSLSWVQDLIIVQLTETKFDIFDLDKGAWSPEAIHYSGQFYCGTPEADDQMEEEWRTITPHYYMDVRWADFQAIHIDDQFVLCAINKKSATLHLIPLRNAHKLLDICWISALNSGLLKSDKKPQNFPYSPLI